MKDQLPKPILRLLLRGLGAVCGLVGLSSCAPGEIFGGTTMYGMPCATWTVSGTVQDSVSGKGVPSLLVSLKDTASGEHADSVRTDSTGGYSLSHGDYADDHPVRLSIADSSGAYRERDSVITLTTRELSGGDGEWDKGSAKRRVDLKVSRLP